MGYFLNGKKIIGLALFVLASTYLFAQQPALTETQKTDHLIAYVASLDGAVFIRNGSEHSAKAAAEHLQMKREKAGTRITTAIDFIEKIAAKSSISGKPYQIRFADGKTFTCETVLKVELKRLEEGKSKPLQRFR
ncbi:MAG: DUF5329 family protein [Bacteroidota bacterium]|jgi:hypothetical protein